MHGKTRHLLHNGRGVFRGLPSPLTVTRYHSLILDLPLPECFGDHRTGETQGDYLGIRHRGGITGGVQFHGRYSQRTRDTLCDFSGVDCGCYW